jgi:hypothetical protein
VRNININIIIGGRTPPIRMYNTALRVGALE